MSSCRERVVLEARCSVILRRDEKAGLSPMGTCPVISCPPFIDDLPFSIFIDARVERVTGH